MHAPARQHQGPWESRRPRRQAGNTRPYFHPPWRHINKRGHQYLYTEYLHWNNCSVLDGIIDRRGNMIVLNEGRLHVNDRKATGDKLIGTYGQHDAFKWSNQSYTAMVSSLFKIQCGYTYPSRRTTFAQLGRCRTISTKGSPVALWGRYPRQCGEHRYQ